MKKLNVINVMFGFISLIIYMYFMIRYGSKYTDVYGVESLYLGAGLSIAIILLAFFKKIRDGYWMDFLFMLYLLLFIVGNFIANKLGTSRKIYAVFVSYPNWFKYVTMVILLINIIMFIITLKEDSNE